MFTLDPPPAVAIKATRLADVAVGPTVSVGPTREAAAAPPASAPPPAPARAFTPAPAPVAAGVGKATVERMLKDTRKKSQTTLWVVAGTLLLIILALGAVFYLYQPKPTVIVQQGGNDTKLASGLTPTQIALANTDSTVLLEVGWKLIDTQSGKGLFHVIIPNQVKDKEGKVSERIPGAGEALPLFLASTDGLEPVLSTDDGGASTRPSAVCIPGAASSSATTASFSPIAMSRRRGRRRTVFRGGRAPC